MDTNVYIAKILLSFSTTDFFISKTQHEGNIRKQTVLVEKQPSPLL